MASGSAGGSHRQDQQPVFVLHTYPFKETSLIVEMFSRDFGRIAGVAKGARRPRSAMRGMLQSFQPLQATWSGKNELRTLHGLDWGEGLLLLQGEALMCGFYLNELLLRLLPREDPHEALYAYYAQTLRLPCAGLSCGCCRKWVMPCRWNGGRTVRRSRRPEHTAI